MAEITLLSPVPPAVWPLLWSWLNEDRRANFDDEGPRTYAAFFTTMTVRAAHEWTWLVLQAGVPVGAIAFLPVTRRMGTFHGICFRQLSCGTGVARLAVVQVLRALWDRGIDKVCASFFSDNRRVRRFFEKLGAEEEGRQVRHTCREGALIDVSLVALFRPADWPGKAE